MKKWTIVILCLLSCRTVKTTSKAREEIKRDAGLSMVRVSDGSRERDVLTYWPDGRVYQFEQLRERMDAVESARLDMKEKEVLRRSEVLKEQEPVKVWMHAGIVLMLMLVLAVVIRVWVVR